ncbi:MAG: hypothetical protein ACK5PW_04925 [Burkholderiales bacterium]
MSRPAPHLVACVASHGWGHLSQTIPMVSALHALGRHARLAPIGMEAVRAGRFEAALERLQAGPARTPAHGDGAAVIADAIAARLGAGVPDAPLSRP